jgi:hypothetical protein
MSLPLDQKLVLAVPGKSGHQTEMYDRGKFNTGTWNLIVTPGVTIVFAKEYCHTHFCVTCPLE